MLQLVDTLLPILIQRSIREILQLVDTLLSILIQRSHWQFSIACRVIGLPYIIWYGLVPYRVIPPLDRNIVKIAKHQSGRKCRYASLFLERRILSPLKITVKQQHCIMYRYNNSWNSEHNNERKRKNED
uniref:Uncharacterized protein n=1 Tax=Cacopsylla melanoneura TaxID=428564 RepID=A0A8D8WHB2_9HEMI